MRKFKFSLFTLLSLITLVALGLGIYQWMKPTPIMFQADAIIELEKGKIVRVPAWTYAVPVPRLDPSQAQMYKAVKWSRARFLDVEEVDSYTQYHTWYPMDLLESDKGERALIIHINDTNVVKVQ